MRSKPGKRNLSNLGLSIAVGILEVENLRRRRDEHAAVVTENRRRPTESVGIDAAPLEPAVTVSVFQQSHPPEHVTRILAVAEHFHDEQSPMFVEVEGHRVGYLRLNGSLLESESR